ncbi:DNA repair helicase RAD25 [Ogataea parapolymorpha DL-1]|uniref:DNA repair helicase RAD25 n=1 Tax=Ogataea parapolymorpha (strain ATCC 26012 / BCRC 20466 / JCM 22074 / NRRL Y-7560 / DL-1) TaxID=871575 RepID=W1QHC9_OGAPD|nr:DNA repair helicase RAD25 [Ogataea parapolymorpha DL-1]ESX01051.1 DNA repair helicase RAD25 [Ogataea parapolymorpha DL-1]
MATESEIYDEDDIFDSDDSYSSGSDYELSKQAVRSKKRNLQLEQKANDAKEAIRNIEKTAKDTKFDDSELVTISMARPPDFMPDSVSAVFGKADFSYLKLKPDHAARPIWISPLDGKIFLEGLSPLSEQAQDFLVTIAEPVSRPSFIHEYRITTHSLYAAVSVGLETDDIISVLSRLSKVPLASSVVNFIKQATVSYGKVKLVLKHNRYFVESPQADILQMLLKDEVIGKLRIQSSETTVTMSDGLVITKPAQKGDLVIPGTEESKKREQEKKDKQIKTEEQPLAADNGAQDENLENIFATVIGDAGEEEDDDTVHSFEIAHESVEIVKKTVSGD